MGMILDMILGGAYNGSVLKHRKNGRTEAQKKVLDYFCKSDGCMSKNMTDSEYDAMVLAEVEKLNLKAKALSKLGIDEDQVKEIEPVHFENYCTPQTDECKDDRKRGVDNILRSSSYQVTWLFFSDAQVYVYQYTFSMVDDAKKERTEEYFYKDVTNFSTTTESLPYYEWETKGCGCFKKATRVSKSENENQFTIIVSGDKFQCSMIQNEYTDKAISGMKAKLREKKA